MYENFVYNYSYYQDIALKASEDDISSELKQDILVNGEKLKKEATLEIKIQQPIVNLINAAQNNTINLADIADSWFKLEDQMPLSCSSNVLCHIKQRKKYALCPVTLTAYFLDPRKDKSVLSITHKVAIERCVNKQLKDITSLRAFGEYKEKGEHFADLGVKGLDAKTFWKSISFEYPELSKLALRALSIPASSAEIERTFSQWKLVHTAIRNKIGPEKSEKLLAAFHFLHGDKPDKKQGSQGNIEQSMNTSEEFIEDVGLDFAINREFVSSIL